MISPPSNRLTLLVSQKTNETSKNTGRRQPVIMRKMRRKFFLPHTINRAKRATSKSFHVHIENLIQ